MISQTTDNQYVEELVADTEADMTTIKRTYNLTTCAPGSSCFVIATGDVYMLNGSGDWIKI